MAISVSKTFYLLLRVKPRKSYKPINVFVGGWTQTNIR